MNTNIKNSWICSALLVMTVIVQSCKNTKSTTTNNTDKSKEPVTDTITYAKASPFQHGFSRVVKDSSQYYIDKNGRRAFDQIINSFQPLDSISSERTGYINLHKNEKKLMRIVETRDQKFGMANEQGDWVLKPQYDSLSFKFKRYVEVYKNDKMTYADSWGKLLLPLKFEDVGIMDGDYYDVKKDGKWGIYQASTDKIVIPFAYGGFDYCGGCGGTPDYFYAKKNGKWGVIDLNNKVLVPFKYEHHHAGMRSDNWVTAFQKNGKNVVINISLSKAYGAPKYTSAEIVNGRLVAKKNGKFGMINAEGKTVVDFKYDDIWDAYSRFKSGPYLSVQKEKKYGVIDTAGNVIIPPNYKKRLWVRGDYFVFQQNDKYGLLNAKNEQILPSEYKMIHEDEINTAADHQKMIFELKKDGKYGFYFPKNKQLLNPKYNHIDFYNGKRRNPFGARPVNLMQVEANEKDQLYDLRKNQLIPGDYAKFELQPHHKVILMQEDYGNQGLYDLQKKQLIIPQNYKAIKVFHGKTKLIKVEKDIGNYNTQAGLFDSQGNAIFPVEYTDIEKLNDSHFLLNRKDSLFSVYSTKSQKSKPLQYDKVIKNDSTDLLTVRKDKKTFLYNYKSGQLQLQKGYADIQQLKNGSFVMTQKDSTGNYKYGYANEKGKLIVPVKYDTKPTEYTTYFENNDYLPLYKFNPKKDRFISNDYKGYADLKGNVLVPPKYKKVWVESSGKGFIVQKATKENGFNNFGVLNGKGKIVIPLNYTSIIRYNKPSEGRNYVKFEFPVLAKKDGMFRFVGKNGKELPLKAKNYTDFKKRKR